MKSKSLYSSFVVFAIVTAVSIALKASFLKPGLPLRLIQNKTLQNGDIIFQSSKAGQSLAIQLATKSKYSHCGIIFIYDSDTLVLEAVQPVKYTPLSAFIKRGDNSHYVIKRLKDSEKILTKAAVNKLIAEGNAMIGKNYDIYFEWGDERLYCSELIYKLYKRALAVEIGTIQKLSEFDLSHKEVKKIMKERYGKNIPYGENVISPASIFNDEKLVLIRAAN